MKLEDKVLKSKTNKTPNLTENDFPDEPQEDSDFLEAKLVESQETPKKEEFQVIEKQKPLKVDLLSPAKPKKANLSSDTNFPEEEKEKEITMSNLNTPSNKQKKYSIN